MAISSVPVSHRALIARINRKLAHEGERLVTTRGVEARRTLGDYYLLDDSRNTVTALHVNPLTLATELGVLKAWETAETA